RGIQFWGSSFVAGPQGEFLAQADTESRNLLIVDVDMARSESVRRIWPFLRDRRIDAYSDLFKRYRDLTPNRCLKLLKLTPRQPKPAIYLPHSPSLASIAMTLNMYCSARLTFRVRASMRCAKFLIASHSMQSRLNCASCATNRCAILTRSAISICSR